MSFFMLYNHKYRCLTYQSRMNSNYKVHPTFTNYAISKDGEVYSVKSKRLLKTRDNEDGYMIVCLQKNKKQHIKSIHRLVLETYNPIENQHLYHAHHENRIRNDNNLKNLEWELIPDHIREHHKGKVVSEETRRKLSESRRGVKISEEPEEKLVNPTKAKC